MSKKNRAIKNPTEIQLRRLTYITVIIDAILLVAFGVCMLLYASDNEKKIYNQNVSSIQTIANANSHIIQSSLDNIDDEVKGSFNFCNGKTITEILNNLSLIDTGEYQLLKRTDDSTEIDHNYTGFSTKKENGNFREVTYENTSLSTSIFRYGVNGTGKVYYSQSFTNATDAFRYFGALCNIDVDEDETDGVDLKRYCLVKLQKETNILSLVQRPQQYNNFSVAVCYTDGKYLAFDNDFRSATIFDYLAIYNKLSLDQKNEIRLKVQNDEDGNGFLVYNDLRGNKTIYAYSTCGDSEKLLSIVSVPVSDFVVEKQLAFFPTIIIVFLSFLLIFNVFGLMSIIRQLRLSVEREQFANLSKSLFLSRMSHEIRTPLNAVIGYNTIAQNSLTRDKFDVTESSEDLLSDYYNLKSKVTDCLMKSEIASKNLLTIINDVLDMSAIESGKIKIANEPFDFRGLITSLTMIFYSQAREKGIEFEVIIDSLTSEWFSGDQMRTNQILTNLLSNALKFTSKGGSVKLKISQPNAESNLPRIRFEITDTGIGMSEEYLKRIWTPFEQADSSISRRFGGTGLGLSITKKLVDLMNGIITVQSVEGEGTKFTVDITYGVTDQPELYKSYDFSNLNALVVDDDPSTCEYVRLLFGKCGARCATVTSGRDAVIAVTKANESGDKFNLCLIDWKMPEMDGIETARHIREKLKSDIPIIVSSAYDYSEVANEAIKIGIQKFISKPLFSSSLLDLLVNLTAEKSEIAVEKKNAADFGGRHLLIAEDNEMNMEIAVKILSSTGITVDRAWNGKEAVKAFMDSPEGTYDIILMDVHMPEMDGHEAARVIRASNHPDAKTIPIIALTADAFAENVAEAHMSGMNDHIAKPIDIHILFDTLRKYIK